jgi:valyl-tRNA synthetase
VDTRSNAGRRLTTIHLVTNTPTPPQPSTDLPTQFQPVAVESQLYERWVKAGYFEATAGSDKPPFCIVIPPPNVTGSLHIGHALDHTLMDLLTRRKRMQGYEVLWLPGMDHAGIATQNVVERELAKLEGKSRHDLGRAEFVRKVWEWKALSGGQILNQMRRLGDGVDWSRERFTMDEGLSRAVLTMFARLYEDGLIYRAERIINWCPRCMTALSDIEVDHAEVEGELTSVRYGSGDATIVVATTRPETILGDTAVAVHPDDERYKHLVGTEVELPLTGRRIPIVADRHVDPDFGTGAVKVTPAHDPNDFEIGKRHALPMITIMDERATITAHGPFEGLDRFEARPAVVRALHEEGRILSVKRPHLHAVGHCSRCDTVVEPRLSLQWFVKVAPLAEHAGAAVRDGRTTVHPPELAKRYFDWVDNMHDWCISRQLWWGHRIPVWYGPDGQMVCVGPNDEAPTGAGWHQDEDVLDTWFSSGLWPFSTLGWPDDTADLRFFYPNSVLVTGYDILFFWVVRMMLFGLYAMDGRQPFDTVVLHGLVRDEFGKKMSKTRGNTVDPIEWMDKYGSDALRFTLARGANPGTDQAISEDWCAGSRNFCNKLWNATRFALLNGATTATPLPAAAELSTVDKWVLSRLHDTLSTVDAYLDDYQFAKATDLLYHFVWDDFCDWYVELAKAPLAAGGVDADRTRAVLGHVLDRLLRVLHPIVPFVTEALWTALTGEESVVISDWPAAELSYRDSGAEETVEAMRRVVTEVRRFRADQGIRPGVRVPARLSTVDGSGGVLAELLPQVRALARLAEPADDFAATATLPGVDLLIELDTSVAIDVAAERARLTKDLVVAEEERHQAQVKLSNPSFVERAPTAVVDKARARQAAAEADVARITARLDALPTQ